MKNILITGGAGFIGSHLVKHFVKKYPNYHIFNVDKLTYASNIKFLNEIENENNYTFFKLDICDLNSILEFFNEKNITHVIHLAAESHVDKSIESSIVFGKSNVLGTLNLLEAAKNNWKSNEEKLFYHISTDEVFGTLGEKGKFSEESKYDPHSPYSASKAASDHFVRAFHDTYKLPTIISNCSNNYGPNQNKEKLIPTIIHNLITNTEIPIYGDGKNIRDWLFVQDHVDAIDLLFHKGKIGETYCIGGENELSNIELTKKIISIYSSITGIDNIKLNKLIKYVKDRLGHDKRYAIDITKIKNEFNWIPKTNLEKGLSDTIKYYLN
ncbi:MAG: dTDP-glucose 4,6-dehydratase [Flavobacteriaceae bacterium]|nr:dTDP-glucose 4,6-dehydratase [Flavobacteriaceae bacterium]